MEFSRLKCVFQIHIMKVYNGNFKRSAICFQKVEMILSSSEIPNRCCNYEIVERLAK